MVFFLILFSFLKPFVNQICLGVKNDDVGTVKNTVFRRDICYTYNLAQSVMYVYSPDKTIHIFVMYVTEAGGSSASGQAMCMGNSGSTLYVH